MVVSKRTYFKAMLLLTVFSLNSVVSFACSFSSLFHGMHHHNTFATTSQEHEGNTQHSHHDVAHSHDASGDHHHGTDDTAGNSEDDCCSESVVQIEKTDKSVSNNIQAPDPLFTTAFFATYTTLLNIIGQQKTLIPTYVRWRVPATIEDIRIVIQSFQI